MEKTLPLISIRQLRKLVGRQFADTAQNEPILCALLFANFSLACRFWIVPIAKNRDEQFPATDYEIICDDALSFCRENGSSRPLVAITENDWMKTYNDVSGLHLARLFALLDNERIKCEQYDIEKGAQLWQSA